MEQICQFCLLKNENSMDSKDEKVSLSFESAVKMVYEIFQIQISNFTRTRQRFKKICGNCQTKLTDSYNFYKTIQTAQDILSSQNSEKLINETPNDLESDHEETLIKTEVVEVKEEQGLNREDLETNELKIKRKTRKTKVHQSEKTVKVIKITPEIKEQMNEEDRKLREFFSLACTICSESFPRLSTYKIHMGQKHKVKRPAIVCCQKRFSRRFKLVEHLIFHTNPEKYKCIDCGKQCIDPESLLRHRRQIHMSVDEREFQCEKCPKKFTTAFNLRSHMRSHLSKSEKESQKNYICDNCGSGFWGKHLLDHHMRRTHLKAYACVCHICAKHFQTKASFVYHYKNEHVLTSKKNVQCSVCQTWLSSERNLKTHIKRLHSETGPATCDLCGKVSPNMNALRNHHKYVHESVPKFTCTYCNKAFKKQITLKEHLTIHVGGALYNCCFCTKTFNSSANMYSHRKKAHPQEHEQLMKKKHSEVTESVVKS